MDVFTSIGVLLFCILLLFIAGELLVNGLLYLSRYLGVKEFVVAFFVMAFASSVPNLFVGVTSALQGVPELSFGDIMGNNIIVLTIGVGLAILFSPHTSIPLLTVSLRHTTIATTIAAVLPLVLLLDGTLSRGDGVVLVLFFFMYMYWLFSKKDNFSKIYEPDVTKVPQDRKVALGHLARVLGGITLLALSTQGIVYVATVFAVGIDVPLIFIGLVVLGVTGALPELYFAVISARRGEGDMVIGNLMGAVIVPATLVLGVVALLHPLESVALEFPLFARIFLVLIALVFFVCAKTNHTLSAREGMALSLMYGVFIVTLFLFVFLGG